MKRSGARKSTTSWIEALKILLRYEPVDESLIASVLERDESTLALLYFHLHFCLIRKSAEWIQGLWETVNERYPGSMIRKDSYVPLAQLGKPLAEARLTLISSCGVHARSDRPLDVCHPFGRIPVPPRALAIAP
jgi:hypothetical protein